MQQPMFKAILLALAVLAVIAGVTAAPLEPPTKGPLPFFRPPFISPQKLKRPPIKLPTRPPWYVADDVVKNLNTRVDSGPSSRIIPAMVDVGRETQQKREGPRASDRMAPGETPRAEGIDVESVRCNTFPEDRSPVSEVMKCIKKLSDEKSGKCDAASVKSLCQSGDTFILGWRKLDEVSLEAPSCKSVARRLGRIMDFCTHDGMVMGETTAWDDPATGVMIRNFAGGAIDDSMMLLH